MQKYAPVILLTLIFSTSANAQTKANIGIGYNVGSHIQLGGLDYVIGRYNNTRSFLTKKMNEPRLFRGVNIALDFYYPKLLVSYELVYRKSDARSEVSTTKQGRDYRLKVNSANIGVGYKLGKKQSSPKGSYLGMDFSVITLRNFTRTFQFDSDKPEYKRISKELALGFTPFLQMVGRRFTAKLYYQMMMTDADFWDVNQSLNPNTWAGDPFESSQGKISSLGISLRYNLVPNGR